VLNKIKIETTLIKVGGSRYLRIPPAFQQLLDMDAGKPISIELLDGELLIVQEGPHE
jgi:antitoxin component of MazEF toxin-antitoxin module